MVGEVANESVLVLMLICFNFGIIGRALILTYIYVYVYINYFIYVYVYICVCVYKLI